MTSKIPSLFGRVLKQNIIDSVHAGLCCMDMEKLQAYIDVANEQDLGSEKPGEPVGSFLFTMAHYSVWTVKRHCKNGEELEQQKNEVIQVLTDLYRKVLEREFKLFNEFSSSPEDLESVWTSGFSTKLLEKKLALRCPELLQILYAHVNDGKLTEIKLEVSGTRKHWALQNGFHFILADYNTEPPYGVLQMSGPGSKRWVFAENTTMRNAHPLLFVDDEWRVHLEIPWLGNKNEMIRACIADRVEDFLRFNPEDIRDGKLVIAVDIPLPSIEEVVGDGNFYCGDAERVDEPDDYESFIKDAFMGICGDVLKLDAFEAGYMPDRNRNWLTLVVNGRKFEFTVGNPCGWVDPRIIGEFNSILSALEISSNSFLEVRDPTWGQEIGIVFSSPEKLRRLRALGYAVNR